jgi:hypothetical protein
MNKQLTQLIIQLPIIEKMGGEKDLNERFRLEDSIDGALKKTNNGYCDGGDIGGGKINIFVYVNDINVGLQAILEVLKKNKISKKPVVALSKKDVLQIIYPYDYKGKFSY